MNNYKENLKSELQGIAKKLIDQNGFFNNTPSKAKHFVKLIKHANRLEARKTNERLTSNLINTFSNKVITK